MTNFVVLGRFQPFHKGHEFLVKAALDLAGEQDTVTVAIGSAQAGWEPTNPWTVEERKQMLEAWSKANEVSIEIVAIEDINDPPNWVEHATKVHGDGVLVTSDGPTAELYSQAGWQIEDVDLSQRESYEGWRVRQTLKMLSTVYDDDAVREVSSHSIPTSIVDWLIAEDAIFRLSTFETGVHAG